MLILCAGVTGAGAGQGDAEAEAVRLATRTPSEHLAERLEPDETGIRLVSMERRSRPDAVLGCPAPGQLCAQVVTDGFRIDLEADGRTFRYHTDERTVRLSGASP